MQEQVYDTLRAKAKQVVLLERMATSVTLQTDKLEEMGVPEIVMAATLPGKDHLKKATRLAKKEVGSLLHGEAVDDFIQETPGLSQAAILFLGLVPPLTDFPNPAKLWKWCGLHVQNGKAPSRVKGEKTKWSPFLKAFTVMRLGKGATTVKECPYRDVYLRRRERTRETHPVMLEKGAGCPTCDKAHDHPKNPDCARFGGPHWSLGHQYVDALRVTAKAIVLDLWRIENGQEPRYKYER